MNTFLIMQNSCTVFVLSFGHLIILTLKEIFLHTAGISTSCTFANVYIHIIETVLDYLQCVHTKPSPTLAVATVVLVCCVFAIVWSQELWVHFAETGFLYRQPTTTTNM